MYLHRTMIRNPPRQFRSKKVVFLNDTLGDILYDADQHTTTLLVSYPRNNVVFILQTKICRSNFLMKLLGLKFKTRQTESVNFMEI